jgi:pilus assembly protein CpaF
VSLVVHVRRGPAGRHVAELGVVRRRGELIEVAAGWRADGGSCPAGAELAELLDGRTSG